MKKYLVVNYLGYLLASAVFFHLYFLGAWSSYQDAPGYDPYLIIFESFILGLPPLLYSAFCFFVSTLFKRKMKKLESGFDLTIWGGRFLKVLTVLEVLLVIFFFGMAFMMAQIYRAIGF